MAKTISDFNEPPKRTEHFVYLGETYQVGPDDKGRCVVTYRSPIGWITPKNGGYAVFGDTKGDRFFEQFSDALAAATQG